MGCLKHLLGHLAKTFQAFCICFQLAQLVSEVHSVKNLVTIHYMGISVSHSVVVPKTNAMQRQDVCKVDLRVFAFVISKMIALIKTK